MAHKVNHLPTMQESQVQSLGREDPLEKDMATHSSTLAWRSLVGYSLWDCTELDTTKRLHFPFTFKLWWTSLVPQTVKCLPTMPETWVQSLSQEDLLEKEMATHSSILAWKTPSTGKPSRLQSMGSQRVGHD